jgi:hypothetical protein
MKKLYVLIGLAALLFTACTKGDYVPAQIDPAEWMRTHDKGVVAYVDYSNGNYIVETYEGYTVIESLGDYTPRENDHEYAYFSSRGVQSIYNRSGNYFTKGRVVESWLSWSDATSLLDDLGGHAY